jgi:hypothetical protein
MKRNAHPLGIMTAPDMFIQNGRQLFDRKTGAWIRTVTTRNIEDITEESEEQAPEQEPVNDKQLKLF